MSNEITTMLQSFVGKTVVGYLLDAFPLSAPDKAKNTRALVFDDGRALVSGAPGIGINGGTLWVEPIDDVHGAITNQEDRIKKGQTDQARLQKLNASIPPRPKPDSAPTSSSGRSTS